jgi:hypothetical protein
LFTIDRNPSSFNASPALTKVVTFDLPLVDDTMNASAKLNAELKKHNQTIEQAKLVKNPITTTAIAPITPATSITTPLVHSNGDSSATDQTAKIHQQTDLDKVRAIRSGKAMASVLPAVVVPIVSTGVQTRESRPPPPSTAPPPAVVEIAAPVVDASANKALAKQNLWAAAALRGEKPSVNRVLWRLISIQAHCSSSPPEW